ncbi:MAG TPA: TlpA disulfide reductase family protein [Steroidobacteraceae bacterium]|nr:TlpA disulfide reductase family protein [Steroidobacteraceae bacterium]
MRPAAGRVVVQLVVLALIVGGIQLWRTRDLLPADERTAAPSFRLPDLDDRTWSSADLVGRPTVVYFFAPWCGVCAASSPQLRWFHRWRGDDVRVVLVGLDWSEPGELREYARKHDLPFPVIAGDAATGPAWRVGGYPTYYVIDAHGRIAGRDVGVTTAVGLWLRTVGL